MPLDDARCESKFYKLTEVSFFGFLSVHEDNKCIIIALCVFWIRMKNVIVLTSIHAPQKILILQKNQKNKIKIRSKRMLQWKIKQRILEPIVFSKSSKNK